MADLQHQLQQIVALDDDSLLRSLKRHVGTSNRVNALVLAHLAEVDARGAYRKWACETLAAYCIYELRLSEDEAQRRCRAARVMRQFPVLFEMIADASIHLTGILLLAPYLTADNHQGVLVRARYRSKREIERLVAELAPSRDVPALVEPLGVACGSRTIPGTGWAALTEGTLGWVRQLEAGDGPARAPSSSEEFDEQLLRDMDFQAAAEGAESGDSAAFDARIATAPARGEEPPVPHSNGAGGIGHPPLHYRVQFTADQAYVDLLERARALLWHQLPNGDLVELQRMALQALVDKLSKRKFGAKVRAGAHSHATPSEPHSAGSTAESLPSPAAVPTKDAPTDESTSHPARASIDFAYAAPARVTSSVASRSVVATREPSDVVAAQEPSDVAPAQQPPDHVRESVPDAFAPAVCGSAPGSRHIPAAVRREVWERDSGRCAFVDTRGQRCRATSAIEFHHQLPHARGGAATPANVSLRCRAHNAFAAEQDFGRAFMMAVQQRAGAPEGLNNWRDT